MAGDVAGATYRLEGLAVPETLQELHELLEQVGADHPDVEVGDLMLFETAVMEVAGNLVEHGRPPGEVTYTFWLDVLPDRLVAGLSDGGEAVAYAAGGAALPDDELSEDGRGLALAEATLDELTYAREDDLNVWRMTRLRRRVS